MAAGIPVTQLAEFCTELVVCLRAAGIPTSTAQGYACQDALLVTAPQTVDEIYWACRVTLTTEPKHIPGFNEVFQSLFTRHERITLPYAATVTGLSTADHSREPLTAPPREPDSSDSPRSPQPPGESQEQLTSGGDTDEAPQEQELGVLGAREALANTAFEAMDEHQLQAMAPLIEALPITLPRRISRRHRPMSAGTRLDLRRTLQQGRLTGGELLSLAYSDTSRRARKLIMIADVSSSMEPYAMQYLHLARGAVRRIDAESFVFSTRLTHLTGVLKQDIVPLTFEQVRQVATDWAGGTQIGSSLDTFLRTYGRRGMAHGAVLLIISDGWDVGPIDVLETAMAHLSRLAYSITWVNPRKARLGYQPLVAGMQAVLPYVDTFVPGHNLSAMQQVLKALCAPPRRRAPWAGEGEPESTS